MEPAAETAAAPMRRRLLWTLVGVGLIAVGGGAAGAYFGLHAARGVGTASGSTPAPRAHAAAAYDDASHQVVLFGGMGTGGAALDDTWTWDGSSWTEQHPSVSPPARAFAAMTYDPHGRDLVLVGGRQVQASGAPIACSGSVSASANAIAPVTPHTVQPVPPTAGQLPPPSTGQGSAPPTAAPAPRGSAAPCPAATPPPILSDTWIWDGSQWHRTGGSMPTGLALETPALATDPTTGQVMLLSLTAPQPLPLHACPVPPPGSPADGAPACGAPAPQAVRAWTWNGSAWQQVAGTLPAAQTSIAVGGAGALVGDPASGHLAVFRSGALVVCGGASAAGEVMPCPLSEGSGSAPGGTPTTPQPSPGVVPPPKPMTPVCCTGSVTVWNGSGWAQPRSLQHSPSVFGTAFAGDPAHHNVVGYTSETTWQWNGSVWTELHPSRSPGRVAGASMVYDGSSGRVLLFGGLETSLAGAQPQSSSALWAWDGSTWTLVGGAAAPSPSPSPTPTAAAPPPSTSATPAPLPTASPCMVPAPVQPPGTEAPAAPTPASPSPGPTPAPTCSPGATPALPS